LLAGVDGGEREALNIRKGGVLLNERYGEGNLVGEGKEKRVRSQ